MYEYDGGQWNIDICLYRYNGETWNNSYENK